MEICETQLLDPGSLEPEDIRGFDDGARLFPRLTQILKTASAVMISDPA